MGFKVYSGTSLILLFLLLLVACQSEDAATSDRSGLPCDTPNSCLTVLNIAVFAEEGRMVMYGYDGDSKRHKFITAFDLGAAFDFPVGIYPIVQKADAREIHFPNDLYRSKAEKLPKRVLSLKSWQDQFREFDHFLQIVPESRVLVFPNDIRETGRMKPCFACPHWMAEVYGNLAAEWQKIRPGE